jgi:hypothetical protein
MMSWVGSLTVAYSFENRCMPAPLSVDLRQRILAAYDAKEGSQRQLAERFNPLSAL